MPMRMENGVLLSTDEERLGYLARTSTESKTKRRLNVLELITSIATS